MNRSCILVATAALLAGCAPSYSPNAYDSAAVQQASKVDQGIVVGVRPVEVVASGATGAITGAAAGGIAGSQAPGGGVATALSTLGGTVVGGLVGVGIERATGDTTAYEYVVRKPNNELVSVTQKDDVPLKLGQKVLVISGKQARIVPDYTAPPLPNPPLPNPPLPNPPLPNPPPPNPAAAPPTSSGIATPGPIRSEPLPPRAPSPTFTPIE